MWIQAGVLGAMALVWAPPAAAWVGVGGGWKVRDVLMLNLGVEATGVAPRMSEGWHPSVALRGSVVGIRHKLIPTFWRGAYARGQYDVGRQSWRGAGGFGGGWMFGGLELGAVGVEHPGGWSPGIEAAGLLTIGYAGLFVRHTWVSKREGITEAGLRLNLPLNFLADEIQEKSRRRATDAERAPAPRPVETP